MCSLVTKEDYDKGMQSQQSSHVGHIEYAHNKTLRLRINIKESLFSQRLISLILLKLKFNYLTLFKIYSIDLAT